MKRMNYYLAALTLLVMSGCNDEISPAGDFTVNGKKEVVTFVFPGTAQGVVPYAAIASADENEIATLDAYVFGADPLDKGGKLLLEDVFKLKEGDPGFGTDKESRTASISIIGNTKKTIYFVANGRTQATLDDYELGVTDTTAFTQKVTEHMGKGLVKCPLLMTARYSIAERTTEKPLPTAPIDITLMRRVARFDVINDSDESTFKIERILVKNARPGAFIFPLNKAYTVDVVAELMEIDFLSFPTANISETGSVLYLYPTVKNGETSFDFKGLSTQSGEKMVQPIKMRKKQTGTPAETALLPIKSNSRYIIQMLATGSATVNANITVKEWLVGEVVDVEAGLGKVKLTLTTTPPQGVTLAESKKLTVPATTTAVFDILVDADTEWTLDTKAPELDWISLTNLPTGGTVNDKFSIAITAVNPLLTAREGILYIRNVKRPAIVQALTIVQAVNTEGFSIKGAKFENNTLNVFGSADKTSITITTTGDASAKVATTDSWITFPSATTRAAQTIEVETAANDKEVERVGTFTITVGELVQKVTVKQAPRNLGMITVTAVGLANGTLKYNEKEQAEIRLLVRSLTDWKVTAFDMTDGTVTATPSAWITDGIIEYTDKKDPKANYDGTYIFKMTANDSYVVRKSKMTLSNTIDPTITFEIIVEQAAKKATFTVTGQDLAANIVSLPNSIVEAAKYSYTVIPTNSIFTDLAVEKSGASSSWLTLDHASITTNGTFTLAAAANIGVARTATITVKMQGVADQVITVNQAVAAPTFTVTGTGLAGNDITFTKELVSVTDYTITPINGTLAGVTVAKTNDASNWLTLATTSLATGGKFTLTAAANTGVERTATITVTMTGATDQVITVTQAEGTVVVPTFTVTGKKLTGNAIAFENTEIAAITYTATLSAGEYAGSTVVVSAGAEWLTLDQLSIATNGKFTLAAIANTGVVRTATVTVTMNGAAAQVITVTQAAVATPGV